MYLGSALAMQVLPSISAAWGAASLLRVVGGMGLAWLLMWRVLMQQVRVWLGLLKIKIYQGLHHGWASLRRWRDGRGTL